MWHLATSKGGKVLLATQTWRNRPGFPGERRDPHLPSPPPTNRPGPAAPSWGQAGGPGEAEGGTSGRAKEEITESTVEMFLLDHRTHPPGQQRGDAAFPGEVYAQNRIPIPGPAGGAGFPHPPELTLRMNTSCRLNPFLFPASGASRKGENDAHVYLYGIFFSNFPLIITGSDGGSGDRCSAGRGCRLKVVLSEVGGGVPGPG